MISNCSHEHMKLAERPPRNRYSSEDGCTLESSNPKESLLLSPGTHAFTRKASYKWLDIH